MLAKLKNKFKRRKKELAERKSNPESFVWYTCKNCEYTFEGNFCPVCGQSVKEFQQPVSHFLSDMMGSLFVLDFRIIRSLPTLLFKPGKISSEYIAGRRSQFIPPFRFFLFASIVFFFLIGTQTKEFIDPYLDESEKAELADSVKQLIIQRSQETESKDTIFAISNLKEGIGGIELVKREFQEHLADSTLSSKERIRMQNRIQAMDNPDYLISTAYKYISYSFFILMPFYALILLLFFRKKRKYYVEHLVFSVNIHTFYFILLSIIVLLSMIFENLLEGMAPWIFLLAFIYAMLGIRNFYKKRWVSSFFYTILTFLIYIISSLILIGSSIVIAIAIMSK